MPRSPGLLGGLIGAKVLWTIEFRVLGPFTLAQLIALSLVAIGTALVLTTRDRTVE